MAFDTHANFAITAVTVAPVPALTGTSLTVTAGSSALFPAVPFNCTVYPSASAPISTNAEIVRVTNIVGDVWTITRTQEGSTAMPIAVGYLIANTITKKVFTDIESAMVQGISAVGGSASGGTVQFDNSPTVSFGRAGQTITASAAAGGGGGAAISAGANSQNTGTVIFSNSNGAAFGLNAGTLTMSYTVPGATVFSNANNVTFGLAGSTITASASNAQSTQPVAASAPGGSFLFSTLIFSNSYNVSWSTTAGNGIVASATVASTQGSIVVVATNGIFTSSQLYFSNSNNISWSTAVGGAVVASATVASTQGSIVFGAVGSTNTGSQIIFSNSNNVSFGLNGSTITASASNAQSTQPVAASASNGSFTFATVGFSNANGVTFGTSAGSIVTASVVSTSNLYSRFEPAPFGNNSSILSFGQNTIYIDPILVPYPGISISQIVQPKSFHATLASTTVGVTVTVGLLHKLAIYSRSLTNSTDANFAANSNSLVSFFSTQFTTQVIASCTGTQITVAYNFHTGTTNAVATLNFSASTTLWGGDAAITGQKLLRIGCATSLSWGEYWIAQVVSSSANVATYTAATALIQNSHIIMTHASNGSWGYFGSSSSTNVNPLVPGLGRFSVTSAAFPASIAISEISIESLRQRYMNFVANT